MTGRAAPEKFSPNNNPPHTHIPMNPSEDSPLSARELILTRDIDVTPEQLYKTWLTRLPEWWAPKPIETASHEIDARPGGVLRSVMRAPDGQEFPTSGVFLELVENRRIVFTDAYGAGWEPSTGIFFTAVVTFEPLEGGRTRYTARALHWREEDCKKHAEMGFLEGWGQVLDQLVAVATGK